MASRTRNAWDTTATGRSSVAAELEAIFAPLPRPMPAPETAEAPQPTTRRARGARLWLALLGAVALAALIASLAFLTPIVRQVPLHRAPKAISVPSPASPPIAHPVATQPAAPVQPGPEVQPAPAPTRAPQEAAHHGRCSRFATQAWCLQGTILAADDQLRGAYAAAIRAGVDRRTLVDIQSDWKRLRGRANRDPQALIRGYALLTQELRAETRRARR